MSGARTGYNQIENYESSIEYIDWGKIWQNIAMETPEEDAVRYAGSAAIRLRA